MPGCKCTQGLLLADYVKSILTLHNLPPDLAAQAQSSPLYGQFDPVKAQAVSRPGDLPATDLTNAFRPDDVPPTIVQAASAKPSIVVQPPAPSPAPSASPSPRRAQP